jgi:hypothetical protein
MHKREAEAHLRAASQVSTVTKHVAQRNLAHDGNEAFIAHGVLSGVKQLRITASNSRSNHLNHTLPPVDAGYQHTLVLLWSTNFNFHHRLQDFGPRSFHRLGQRQHAQPAGPAASTPV